MCSAYYCTCCRIIMTALIIFGVVCIIFGVVIGFAVMPEIIRRAVINRVKLEENTEQFNRWVQMPFPLTFKVYFFEVLNPSEVLSGAKPTVKEKGPYVYLQTRRKRNIVNNLTNDTLLYYQDMFFHFDAEASYPRTENDTITTLNLPLMGIFQTLELLNSNLLLRMANFEWQEAFPDSDLFTEFTVKEYLFNGFNFCQNTSLSTCTIIRSVADEVRTLEVQEDDSISFAFLKYKKNTHDGSYLITAGNDHIHNLGKIRQWNGGYELPVNIWGKSGVCRTVRGRDSTIFPPFIHRDKKFDLFLTDVCRVTTIEYVHNEEFRGVTGQRRELRDDTLSNTKTNACYCTQMSALPNGTRTCWPNGFQDLYTCTGTTLIMSYPHFLNADSTMVGSVDGLRPVKEDHGTYFTLEPGTGTRLRCANRMQYNMVIRPVNSIDATQNMARAVLPLLWIEEGMELPQGLLNRLRNDYLNRLTTVDVVTWVLIAVGIALIICPSIYFICCRASYSNM